MTRWKSLRKSLNFNPRTREGCDNLFFDAEGNINNFNPRTREGCDDFFIHHKITPLYFNPRTREGCDHPVEIRLLIHLRFQSTHPRGVRR